ncbi:MAG: hypothetical protein H7Y27_12155 [Gemmatimonadaceae bacterium]|nr:hypothetical protein [Chitinophagaceae bacterium]
MTDAPVLTSDNKTDEKRHSGPVRFFAHFISVIFHPLFLPLYVAAYLIFIHPYAFAGLNEKGRIFKFLFVFISTTFFPAFAVLLMKLLGFVDSMMLRTKKDRIIPYIVSMIFFFWVWYVSRNQGENPAPLVAFLLSCFVGSIVALMANIYFKISMHGIGVGSFLTFFLWMPFTGDVPMGIWISIAVLITGLVCTARLIVSDHTEKELYAGLVAGTLCMLLGIFVEG